MDIESVSSESVVDAYLEHKDRLMAGSGKEGDPIHNPFESQHLNPNSKNRPRVLEYWGLSLDKPGWRRSWGVRNGELFVGSIELTGGDLHSDLHRVNMMMGLERGWRGKGHGKSMLVHAISWAKDNGAAWMDLGVFANNPGAMKLYESLGFKEVGRVPDRFRVYGEKIEEIEMTLDLSR